MIITANHFGIEIDPDKHVQIVKGGGAPSIRSRTLAITQTMRSCW